MRLCACAESGSQQLTPSNCSMFVEDENSITEAEQNRRMKVVEQLLERDFNLASQVIQEFKYHTKTVKIHLHFCTGFQRLLLIQMQ